MIDTNNIRVLHDYVMIRPMPMHLKKTADGIIIPGDMDKMAPKRATVVGAGPGTHKPNGTFVPSRFKVGDQVLYMERGIINVKVDGEDFFMLKQEDVIVKIGFEEPGPDDSLAELSDEAYQAETIRRQLIAHLKSKGLVRLQDMVNPVETYISSDGNHQEVVNARSFKVTAESINEYVPDQSHKAFAMYKVNFLKLNGEVIDASGQPTGEHREPEVWVTVRLAFLKSADLTLG